MIRLAVLACVAAVAAAGSAGLSDDPRPPHDNVSELIAKFDTDGDGFVSKDELGGDDWIFERLDANGDRLLSAGELGRTDRIAPPPRDGFGPGPMREEVFAQADGNKDEKISPEEFLEWHKKTFSRLDRNEDGFLTQDEFPRAPRSRGGPQDRTPAPAADMRGRFADGALKRMDTDQDGKISRDEWKGNPEGFDRADKNFDGFVDLTELSQMRQPGAPGDARGRGTFRRREPGEILKRMDADGDGAITRDEFQGRDEAFDRLDRNGDGKLDRNDLPPNR